MKHASPQVRSPRHWRHKLRLGFPPAPLSPQRRHKNMPMLRLERVEAAYGLSRVLHGVTLEAREGEVVSLLGRNGAGKSTTLKAILGLVDVHFPKLAQLARRRGGSLSGGEQQMLTVARTLMGNPRVLLLDEPSEGLAPVIVRALGDQIAALKREGLTILLSEQNLKFAARLADRAYIIEKGEIRFDGPMSQLMADEALRRKYLTV